MVNYKAQVAKSQTAYSFNFVFYCANYWPINCLGSGRSAFLWSTRSETNSNQDQLKLDFFSGLYIKVRQTFKPWHSWVLTHWYMKPSGYEIILLFQGLQDHLWASIVVMERANRVWPKGSRQFWRRKPFCNFIYGTPFSSNAQDCNAKKDHSQCRALSILHRSGKAELKSPVSLQVGGREEGWIYNEGF